MTELAPLDPAWVGASEPEVLRMLRRGRLSGVLGLDEVLEVLRDVEITPGLIAQVRTALKAEGIVLNETIDIDLPEGEAAPGALRSFHNNTRPRPVRNTSKPTGETTSTDPVRMYLREIGEVDLVTTAQEVALAERIASGAQAEVRLAELSASGDLDDLPSIERARLKRLQRDGDRAREELTQANLRLVVSIAKRYAGRGMPLLDLIQEGNLGLMRAVEKFDHTRGFKLSTYATWWIRQSITRAIADQARTIRIPVHMVEAMNKVRRVQRQMHQRLEREPTIDELAEEVDMAPDRVRELLKISLDPLSLDTPVGEEDDANLADFIEDQNADSPLDAAARQMLGEAVLEALDDLSEREKDVVRLRFGLVDGRPRTLEDVGKQFNVTRERIRQIEAKTLAKLRHPQRSEKLRDYLDGG